MRNNLPVSIVEIVEPYDADISWDFVQAIAHEACRLQRESDRAHHPEAHEALLTAPLVVPPSQFY